MFRIALSTCCLFILFAPASFGFDDTSDEVDKVRAYLERRRAFELRRRESILAVMTAQDRNLQRDRATKAGQDRIRRHRQLMALMRAEITRLESAKNPEIEPIDPIKAHAVGYLKQGVTIRTVIDRTSALAEIGGTGVLLKGFDTSDLVEGKDVDLASRIVEVLPPVVYKSTKSVTRTVFVVQPFDVERANKELDKAQGVPARKDAPSIRPRLA